MLISLTIRHNKATVYVNTKKICAFGPSESLNPQGSWVRIDGEDYTVVETPEAILAMVPPDEW